MHFGGSSGDGTGNRMGLTGGNGTVDDGRLRRWGAVMLTAVSAAVAAPVSVAAASPGGAMIPVVVRGQSPACTSAVADAVTSRGGRMTRTLDILGGGAATVPSGAVATLRSAPCVAAVTPDGALAPASDGTYDPTADTGSLYNTTQAIGAQVAWSQGYTGQGVGVALIDTGVSRVQGLRGRGHVINGLDVSFDSQSSTVTHRDGDGHGTFMAGIIAGNDKFNAQSGSSQGNGNSRYAGDTRDFVGVAPDAHIVSVKIGDANGVADVSQVIAAIDWVVQHRDDPGLNIRVLNLSYGTTSQQSYELDPLAFATEVAWQSGIVVVAAAGNQGTGANGLTDPAYDPYVIAVGAASTNRSDATSDDTVAGFSSYGDGVRNPDVLAPGVHIESLRVAGSTIDQKYGSTATVAGRYFLGSGTSQAAAVVSGAAALLLDAQNMTPDQVKQALMQSASPLANAPTAAQGAGEINVRTALASGADGPAQTFVRSTGLGTLEATRGGLHVVDTNGVALTGEQDIFGNAWDSAAMAQAALSGTAWAGGTFNGAAWSGAAWSGAAWSGAAWSGAGWSGAGWSGAAWSGAAWSGAAWSGAAWSDDTWS
ncbi:MAG: peptidase S8 and S53 subtilisin kexin sedolisin [Chloroflexi bacterium]|nr:MAG: peptidase S8 and S53 subtilisin kexin sedolisin [Chloroflexota bacterium]